MERVLILNEQSAWLYPSILTDSLKMDYPFQIACVQPPSPLRKNRRRGAGQSQTDNPFLALASKRPITKFPCPVFLMIAKDCTERLSAVALSIASLSARLMRLGSKCLHRDCVGRRRTGTRHGNVYLSVRQKKGIVVYRQRVYKQWHLWVLFH